MLWTLPGTISRSASSLQHSPSKGSICYETMVYCDRGVDLPGIRAAYTFLI